MYNLIYMKSAQSEVLDILHLAWCVDSNSGATILTQVVNIPLSTLVSL